MVKDKNLRLDSHVDVKHNGKNLIPLDIVMQQDA
jgi:hypothetical protein